MNELKENGILATFKFSYAAYTIRGGFNKMPPLYSVSSFVKKERYWGGLTTVSMFAGQTSQVEVGQV